MIAQGDIRGVTSNPSIFKNAIATSQDYQSDIEALAGQGFSGLEIYEKLAIADIQDAADLFRPLFDSTSGGDGYVSLEVNPIWRTILIGRSMKPAGYGRWSIALT